MRITRIDVYLSGRGDGYVVTPAGVRLPDEQAVALGGVHHAWTQDVGEAACLPGWRALRADIDACGYGILSDAGFAALLLPPRLQACVATTPGARAAA